MKIPRTSLLLSTSLLLFIKSLIPKPIPFRILLYHLHPKSNPFLTEITEVPFTFGIVPKRLTSLNTSLLMMKSKQLVIYLLVPVKNLISLAKKKNMMMFLRNSKTHSQVVTKKPAFPKL